MISYEAAILRFCPDPVGGEFVNVGLVMLVRNELSQAQEFNFVFETKTRKRAREFFKDLYDSESFTAWRNAWITRCAEIRGRLLGDALLSPTTSFEEILADIQTNIGGVFIWSETSVGFDETAGMAFQHLVDSLLLRHIEPSAQSPMSDRALWEHHLPFIQRLIGSAPNQHLFHFEHTAGGRRQEVFQLHWRNGRNQFLEPLSLAGRDPDHMKEKTDRFAGRLFFLQRDGLDFRCTVLIAPPPDRQHQALYHRRKNELLEAPCVRRVIEESELDGFLQEALAEAHPEPEPSTGSDPQT